MHKHQEYVHQILEAKKKRLEGLSAIEPKEIDDIIALPNPPSFYKAMKRGGLSIIGEIKRASPSKGLIRPDFRPLELAKAYEKSVDAISVLTEEDYFLGKDAYLQVVSQGVSIPTLCKDFVMDIRQIYRARRLGASCILLIVAILDDNQLKAYIEAASSVKMDTLVEVHNQVEIERAIAAGAKILGINNRNLRTFHVDISRTAELIQFIPDDCLVISESGIQHGDQVRELSKSGIDGILVGESFMRSEQIHVKAKELRDAYET